MIAKSKTKGRFSTHDQILRLVITAFLSALGYVLMMLGKVLPYPLLPFLEIEPSDAVVLVAYALYGFWSSGVVAVLKTVLTMLTFGPVGSPIPVGQITAIITSLAYSFGLFIMDKVFRSFSKGTLNRIISYVFVILFVSSLLTYLNYLFITPTFMTYGAQFLTVYDFQNNQGLNDTFNQYFGVFKGSYGAIIFLAYFPFNLLKGLIVCCIYELVFNRVIFHILKSGMLGTNAFMKAEDFASVSPFSSLLVLGEREAKLKAKIKEKEKKKKDDESNFTINRIKREKNYYQIVYIVHNDRIVKTPIEGTLAIDSVKALVQRDYPDSHNISVKTSEKTENKDCVSCNESEEDFFDKYHADSISIKTITYLVTIE